MKALRLLLVLAGTIAARKYTDEELSTFPKLFHLDDYDRCLARKDGLYCLGIFDLTPDVQPNPTYDLLKEYSDESYRHFNRTRIHRGYCVSSRCPNDEVRNASERFERCADRLSQPHTLRASINTFHYCHNHADKNNKPQQTPAQELFLQCVYAIIVLNVIGTIYDVYKENSSDKNILITAFSLPANWRRLTANYEGGDPRHIALIPLNGFRVVVMGLTTYAHSNVFHYSFYLINPEHVEKQTQQLDVIVLSSGTSLIQSLVMVSCFLTVYNLLIFAQKRPLSVKLLPLLILKRFIRIAPVNLLVIGFAATWWLHTREGPLVPTTIGLDHRICQTKFWSHVFLLNNIVKPSEYCIAPTWFLAVDMHMYIVACTLTLILWRHRSTAIKLYAVLLAVSCAFIGVVAYIKEYQSLVYLAKPEEIRVVFKNSPSFTEFYISSWGALPACFLGLLMANILFELDERCIKVSNHKCFVYLHYITFPFIFIWPATGKFARNYSSAFFYGIHSAFDRTLFCILISIAIFGVAHIDSPMKRFFGWRGWTTMAHMSLAVFLLHWCVNMTIGTRPVVYSTSVLDVIKCISASMVTTYYAMSTLQVMKDTFDGYISYIETVLLAVDWMATNGITYLIAVPVTLLVEIPMQKFLGSLIF